MRLFARGSVRGSGRSPLLTPGRASHSRSGSGERPGHEHRRREIDGLLVEVAARVRRGELLRLRGGGDHELEEHRAEIDCLRWRLPPAARASAVGDDP